MRCDIVDVHPIGGGHGTAFEYGRGNRGVMWGFRTKKKLVFFSCDDREDGRPELGRAVRDSRVAHENRSLGVLLHDRDRVHLHLKDTGVLNSLASHQRTSEFPSLSIVDISS